MDLNIILDIAKTAIGLLYLYLEYNARKSLWIVSVIMPVIGMWLFWNKGLYADFGINIYYLVIAVYGYITWSRGSKAAASVKGAEKEVPISHIPLRYAAALLCVWLAAWALIAFILYRFTDSTVPLLDSFTTSLSFAGMWMLARKYMEQWWVWFVVDAVYVYLYYYKGIYFSGSLYAFYTVMAVLGYLKWRKLQKRQQ